jgi:hypothetical protein
VLGGKTIGEIGNFRSQIRHSKLESEGGVLGNFGGGKRVFPICRDGQEICENPRNPWSLFS